MNYLKSVFLLLILASCSIKEQKEVPQEDLQLSKDELSIFHLPSTWKTQNNNALELKDLRGHVVVMVMIYTSCQASCPRLVADMRHLEEQLADKYLRKTKFVLISIDPETDTPEKLLAFSKENEMTDPHWLFLQGNLETVQEVALVLGMKYKKISPIDYSHSNIISVFDQRGVLAYQKEGLGLENEETVNKIIKLHK
jgi:protein SCO1/2